ncbi:MAG: aryl-sulfate sulfotransferase [Chitinophagales bacterium]|nr:aryl-sulfate sulfotransferase [Chitinophagales bacterium]
MISLKVSAQFQFVAPLPGSSNQHPDRNIILREEHRLNPASLITKNLITITGSISGNHDCVITLSNDHKTINLKPITPFVYSENVIVNTNGSIVREDGKRVAPLQLKFSIQREFTAEEKSGIKSFLQKMQTEGVIVPQNAEASTDRSAPKVVKVIVNNNPADGDIFMDYFNGFGLGHASYHIINNNGDSVYSKKKGRFVDDFKLNHNNYLTLFNGNVGQFELYDSSFNLLKTFAAVNGYLTDNHELQLFPNGHYYLIGLDPESVDMSVYNPDWQSNVTVVYTVIQEFDAGDHLIFEWNSKDHISVLEALHEHLDYGYIDAVHTNSIEEDNDGNIIVSHKHLDQITKIDVNTGKFIWRLGGLMNEFTFTNDPEQFNYQHDARRIANGHITLFDNNNWGSQISYAKEYRLDEINKKATLAWSYRHSYVNGKPVYGFAMGSVQRLANGNTFINWGWIVFNSGDPEYTEVDANKNIVWEAELTPGKYNVSYRAHRYLWNPCAIPTATNLKTTDVTSISAHLTWGVSNGAVKYRIHYRVEGTPNWTNVITKGNNTWKKINNLQPDTEYQWQVKSLCDPTAPSLSRYSELEAFSTLSSGYSLDKVSVIEVYPNPASAVINISVPHSASNYLRIELFNQLGKMVFGQLYQGKEGSFRIPVSTLSDGVYFLKIICGEYVYSQKMIVSR